MIEKSSLEEGALSQQVRNWTHRNLNLKVELPALELLNDSSLRGANVMVVAKMICPRNSSS